jgi:L-aspartate oxidase
MTTPNLIIGSGIAGLSLALKLADAQSSNDQGSTSGPQKVLLIAKAGLTQSNTWYAQGGIASVLDVQDSFADHMQDTMVAGAGLCHPGVVDMVVKAGPRLVRELVDMGVRFTSRSASDAAALDPDAPLHLTREGGHSHRRVIHADDWTGQAIMRVLLARARAHPRITVLENQMAVDLLTTDKYAPSFRGNRCIGAYVLDRESQRIYQVRSDNTFLCTGGHGKAYLYTSNPDAATGDGLAMGWRAGCKVANLEFMQFHPTCLYHPHAKTFLISEAVRGEGGVLKDRHGHEFMPAYHPAGSLAPRDIVARAIDAELKKSGDTNVYLDVRHLGAETIRRLFPNIHQTCLSYGIDMAGQMIPVVPAAHYSCGGLVVDDVGRTGVAGLFALGETACTGLHGANRLASNSLLEALVFADRAAAHVLAAGPVHHDEAPLDAPIVPDWNAGRAVPADEVVVLSHAWDEIRRLMWHYVGIVRTEKRLKRALSRLMALQEELDTFYWEYQVTDSLLEVRNLALVAALSVRCAMARKESRGIHFTLDYPEPNDLLGPKDTILVR